MKQKYSVTPIPVGMARSVGKYPLQALYSVGKQSSA